MLLAPGCKCWVLSRAQNRFHDPYHIRLIAPLAYVAIHKNGALAVSTVHFSIPQASVDGKIKENGSASLIKHKIW